MIEKYPFIDGNFIFREHGDIFRDIQWIGLRENLNRKP